MNLRTRNLLIAGVLLATLAAAVAFGISLFRASIKVSLEFETRYHAAILAHGAIRRFESEHNRRPTSWQDFNSMTPLAWSSYELPRDIEPIQEWITIDFESLQTADPVTDSIHPTGTTYDGWEDLLPLGIDR